MSPNEIKYDLLKTELSLTQSQMDKYDQLSSTVKTWTMTIWAASVGWAIQSHEPSVSLLGGAAVVFFWVLDAYLMMFRLNYRARRDDVAGALGAYAEKGEFPAGTKALDLPTHDNGGLIRSFSVVRLSLPYAVLAVLTAAVFFIVI